MPEQQEAQQSEVSAETGAETAQQSASQDAEKLNDNQADKQQEAQHKPADVDWRKQFIAPDASDEEVGSREKLLSRYNSPADLAKHLDNVQKKLDGSPRHLESPKGDASDEEISAYRKQNNIPADVDGYMATIGKDVVLNEADTEMLKGFVGHLNKRGNIPADAASAAAEWYLELQDSMVQDQKVADDSFKNDSDSTLAQEWGADFKVNSNLTANFLSGMSKEFTESINNARTADGRELKYDVGFRRELASLARKLNPQGALMPQGVTADGLGDEIQKLEAKAGSKQYTKQDRERLTKLYEAQEATK